LFLNKLGFHFLIVPADEIDTINHSIPGRYPLQEEQEIINNQLRKNLGGYFRIEMSTFEWIIDHNQKAFLNMRTKEHLFDPSSRNTERLGILPNFYEMQKLKKELNLRN